MASYKAHTVVGVMSAGAAATTLPALGLAGSRPQLIPLFLILGGIGAFLPDIDSDSGIPFRIVMWLTAIGTTAFAIALIFTPEFQELSLAAHILIPAITLLATRYIGGWLAKKFTKHRGMFHSIPAAAIATLLAFHLARTVLPGDPAASHIALSGGIGIGFLSHLVLDEVYSFTNFEGIPFKPKKSLGTALKFRGGSWALTLSIYTIIIFLVSLI